MFGLRTEIREMKEAIADLRVEKDRVKEELALAATVVDLQKQLSELEISKSKKQEEYDKQERELRHMIGLEKKRQEFEIEQAKKETTLTVRQENLTADKKRFEEQLKFSSDRFETMEKYLKDILGQVLDRLPHVNVDRKVGR